MDLVSDFFYLIIEIIIFIALTAIGTYIYNGVLNNSDKLSGSGEVLPEDEVHTLRQLFYLIVMSLAFVNIIYAMITRDEHFYFVIFDILLSVFLAVRLDKNHWKGKLIFLLLVPYDSINFLLLDVPFISVVDFIHVFIFIYFIKVYYDKFRQYTESNGLSITILLLYVIVFLSFIFTQVVEHTNPLDSLVMVSNAFTSNGYAILGTTIPGKINAILLVWGGYILSGVGTATLTAAILLRHFNSKFDDIKESNKELKESLNNLEELIRNGEDSNQNDGSE